MGSKVVEAMSVSSAPGWWLSRDACQTFEPVACWILALVLNDEYATLAPDRVIVGLTGDEFDLIAGLELSERSYHHETAFKVIGEELR